MAATILVVDDFPSGRALLDAILSSQGYTVVTAQSGDEALELVRRQPPELILMDIEMPGMNGYDACRALKQDPRTAGIPVLMVTGLDSADDIRTALRQGADGYIMKPINAAEVHEKIPQMLELAKTGKLPGQFYLKNPGTSPSAG